MKKVVFLFLMLIILPALFGDTPEEEALRLYARALELIYDHQEAEGIVLLEKLRDHYPGTEEAGKAEDYLNSYAARLDKSGIIPYYAGWLATAEWVALGAPSLLGMEDDTLLSLMGILGVGAGLGTAWITTRDANMSLGQDLWIESAQILAMTNWSMAVMILNENLFSSLSMETMEKINGLGSMGAGLAARIAVYQKVHNTLPDKDSIAFATLAYGWSHVYYWLITTSIKIDDPALHLLAGLVLTDGAFLGAYALADDLDWSMNRSGIVTISGAGGMLIGEFAGLIMAKFKITLTPEVESLVITLGALGGQFLGAWLTRDMDLRETSPLLEHLSVIPIAGTEGPGVQIRLSY